MFHFDLAVRLPGRADSSVGSPSEASDGTLTWSAPLGSAVTIGAVSETVDWAHVTLVAVLAGLALFVGGGGLGWRLVRRRRRKSAPGDVDAVPVLVGETPAADPGGDLTAWPTV